MRTLTGPSAPASRSASTSEATAKLSSRAAWVAARPVRALTCSSAPAFRSGFQQQAEAVRVVEGGVAGRVAGQQRGDLFVRALAPQRIQQPGDTVRVVDGGMRHSPPPGIVVSRMPETQALHQGGCCAVVAALAQPGRVT
jgi:hypothetical protein